MTNHRALPSDIAAFLSHAVRSPIDLDVLLFMADEPGRKWRPDEVALLLGRSKAPIRVSLLELFQRGMLRSQHGGQALRFTFDPDPSTAEIVRRLAHLYFANKAVIVAAIRESGLPRAS